MEIQFTNDTTVSLDSGNVIEQLLDLGETQPLPISASEALVLQDKLRELSRQLGLVKSIHLYGTISSAQQIITELLEGLFFGLEAVKVEWSRKIDKQGTAGEERKSPLKQEGDPDDANNDPRAGSLGGRDA